MYLHCEGNVSNSSIKRCGRSWSSNEDEIFAYSKAISGKIVKVQIASILLKSIHFEPNSFMHMFNVSAL